MLRGVADGQYPNEGTSLGYHTAAAEALQRIGLPVPPRRRPPPPGIRPQFRPPTIESLRKTIADRNAPQGERVAAANQIQVLGEKALPVLPALWTCWHAKKIAALVGTLKWPFSVSAPRRFPPSATP